VNLYDPSTSLALIVLLPMAMCAGIGIVALLVNAVRARARRRAECSEIAADTQIVRHRR
jgi:hypothetical protein